MLFHCDLTGSFFFFVLCSFHFRTTNLLTKSLKYITASANRMTDFSEPIALTS